jgi:hypothetical protein
MKRIVHNNDFFERILNSRPIDEEPDYSDSESVADAHFSKGQKVEF